MKKTIISIILVAILFLSSCTKTKSVNDYAKEIADKQEWFDYSYEIVENYDEDNVKRYHITYYFGRVNQPTEKLEIIGYIQNGEFIYEVIVW